MESNLANKGKKFNSEFPPFNKFIEYYCREHYAGHWDYSNEQIYIVPALMGSIVYKRDQKTFPVKGQIINILAFAGFTISVATIQLCP